MARSLYSINASEIALPCAGSAQSLRVALDLSMKVDTFAAFSTHNALTLVAGKVFRFDFDADVLKFKELIVGHFSIGEHLLLVLAFDFRMKSLGGIFG